MVNRIGCLRARSAFIAALLLTGCASTSEAPPNSIFGPTDVVFIADQAGGVDAVSGDASGADTAEGAKDGESPQDGAVVTDGASTGETTSGDTAAAQDGGDAAKCTSTCESEGAAKCSTATAWQQCEDLDDDGCFDWGKDRNCGLGEVCKAGKCEKKCADEQCTAVGAKKCSTTGEILECFDYNNDGCLEWGNAIPCPLGQVCDKGFCALGCTNDCTTVGAK